MASVGEVTVKVKADLSAFTHATVEDVAKVIAAHVYGDGGPVADPGSPSALNVCTDAAAELCERFNILPA